LYRSFFGSDFLWLPVSYAPSSTRAWVPTWRRVEFVWAGCGRKSRSTILRHAKSHVTKNRYIKAFDPAGSLAEVFHVLEPVKEWKEIAEARVKYGGDKPLLTILNLLGREQIDWDSKASE
jgi:hypothetical protein